MNPSTRPSPRGFTLIELLTVIAIIGILAAIIIPVVGKVRASARQAACSSNLRQIGGAFHLYAQENRGLLPAAMDANNGGNNPSGGFWMVELNPYVGKAQALSSNPNADTSTFFICPTYQSEVPTVPAFRGGYGMNTRPKRLERIGTASARTSRTLMSFWPEPSRNIIVGESNRQTIDTSSAGVFSTDPNTAVPDRHGSRSNYAFLDGSVRSLNSVEAGALLRWTNP